MYDQQNSNDNNVHNDSPEVNSSNEKPTYSEVKSSVCDFLFAEPDFDVLGLSSRNPRMFSIIIDFINLCYYLRSGNNL